MPNWCDNDLSVRGPKGDVARMVAEVFTSEGDKCPDFEKIIPYPTKYAEHDKRVEELSKKAPKTPEAAKLFWVRNGFKDGRPTDAYNSGGYEWCIASWGTKWPACEPRQYGLVERSRTATLKVRFDTAWSPPKPVIMALSRKFPTLTINMRSYECGAAYKCHLRAKGGVAEVDASSHYSGSRGG